MTQRRIVRVGLLNGIPSSSTHCAMLFSGAVSISLSIQICLPPPASCCQPSHQLPICYKSQPPFPQRHPNPLCPPPTHPQQAGPEWFAVLQPFRAHPALQPNSKKGPPFKWVHTKHSHASVLGQHIVGLEVLVPVLSARVWHGMLNNFGFVILKLYQSVHATWEDSW